MPTWEQIKESKPYKVANAVLSFAIAQWFFVVLAVFIALAHSFPNFAKQGGLIKAQYTIGYGAVAVIFLISGLSMSTKDLMKNAANWRAHFTVLSTSFLITSSIIYGLASAVRAAHDGNIDDWLLVGLIVTHACPTTVSSNVVMTKQAHGNDILTLCEVFIGNVLGAFITPALLQLYMTGGWDFGNPSHQPSGDSTITQLYAQTMKQLGLSVFIPLFVGQVIQNVFPKQTKWTLTTFKLSKVGSFMLLLIMFQSFSTAFAQHAFEEVSHASIIFIVFFNVGIYLFFTVLTYFYARPYFIKKYYREEPNENSTKLYRYGYKFFRPFYYNRRDTVALMLCGPAKTAALGVSLVSSQYGSDNPKLGIILVPLVLYQSEQVISAQVLVNFMRKWIYAGDAKHADEENLIQNEAGEAHDETDQESNTENVIRSTMSISDDSQDHKRSSHIATV
ncbi:putative sodium bile acid cotransporter [Scheffersomyces xylosifermentans]|uniref:putative sodium bile acid cotransporter n=1 Tax=Scheffersomyces xylosifermentans TaxID=1304137 RepID=UPI00315D03F5